MPEKDLEYKLSELAARLARVERRLGILPPEEVVAKPETPAVEAPSLGEAASTPALEPVHATVWQPSPLPVPVLTPVVAAHPPLSRPTLPPSAPPTERQLFPGIIGDRPRAKVIPAGLFQRPAAPAKRVRDAFSLESLIGGRWFMVAGALIVVVAIGLGLQLAYKAGLFGLMTPGMKCLGVAGFGAVLLGLGEAARRKINAAASAGLSAAGIAALYASAYAAYGPFDLIGPVLGFALLAAVSALGIAVAVRAGLLSVAALSIIASYLTPMLLNDAPSGSVVLPAYLLAVLGVGLWLSAWRRVPFRPLRGLVWWGTMVYGAIWTLGGDASSSPVLAFVFLGLVWCAVHAELMFSAKRGAIGQVPAPASGRIVYQIVRPLLTSFSSTAWAVGLGVLLIRTGSLALPKWFPPAGGTVAATLLAMVLAGNVRVLRERPRDDSERLGAALAMQAGALLIAAISLGLADWMEVVAWLALGAAAVGVGRWIGGRALYVYGLIVLSIGAGRLIVYDSWWWGLGSGGSVLLWLHLSRWTGLVALAAAAWLGAAWFIRAPRGEELSEDLSVEETAEASREARRWWPVGHACVGVGLALVGISLVHKEALATPIAVVFAMLGVAGSLAGRRLRSEGLVYYGVMLIAGATAWLGMADWRLLAEGDATVRVAGLVLTRWSAGMALAAVSWLAVWRIARREALESEEKWAPAARVLLATGITTLFASLLHPDGSTASESIVGMGLAIAMVAMARRSRSPAMTIYSLIVLGLVTVWLILFEWATAGTRASAHEVGGLVVTRWTGLMALIGVAWIIAGRAVGVKLGRAAAVAKVATTGLGLGLLLASLLHGQVDAAWLCGAWLAISAGILACNRLDPTAGLDRFGLGALVLTLAAWIAAFPARDWFSWASPPGLHPGLWMALAMVGVAGAAWRFRSVIRAGFDPRAVLGPTLATVSIALVFAATSLEVARAAGDLASDERARKAAVSIWWGLFAIAMVAGGFWKRWPASRYVGLGLMALAAAKALVYDLRDISPAWRIASLLGLGLLMMGVALGYSRVAQRMARPERDGESEDSDPTNGREKSGIAAKPE